MYHYTDVSDAEEVSESQSHCSRSYVSNESSQKFLHTSIVSPCSFAVQPISQITLPVMTLVPRLRPSRFHLRPILGLNLYLVFNIRSKEKNWWSFWCDFFSMFQIRRCNGKTIQSKSKSEEPSEAWQVVYPLKVILLFSPCFLTPQIVSSKLHVYYL